MAHEQLTLAAVTEEDVNKTPRLPRWTRQELLVLIQGKRVAENRVRRGRTAVLAFGSSHVEPKWSSVSSYCKRHGVNRGPVQCRKRWSNLAGDFKKIKEWETTQVKEEAESFWVMRNDLRRERKLPGFFDREVYDILDGGNGNGNGSGGGEAAGEAEFESPGLVLSLAPSVEVEKEEVVFDSGRSSAAGDDGLFSDEAMGSPENHDPVPISATKYEAFSRGAPESAPEPAPTSAGAYKETSPGPGSEGRKRKRDEEEEETSLQMKLIEALERNGRLLSSQLEIQNTNSQLDREQRKDHSNNLFSVLNKLADAMLRIADKL